MSVSARERARAGVSAAPAGSPCRHSALVPYRRPRSGRRRVGASQLGSVSLWSFLFPFSFFLPFFLISIFFPCRLSFSGCLPAEGCQGAGRAGRARRRPAAMAVVAFYMETEQERLATPTPSAHSAPGPPRAAGSALGGTGGPLCCGQAAASVLMRQGQGRGDHLQPPGPALPLPVSVRGWSEGAGPSPRSQMPRRLLWLRFALSRQTHPSLRSLLSLPSRYPSHPTTDGLAF